MKNRIVFLDIAKGIGIILLFVLHSTDGLIHNFISLFFIPLFFIVSGVNIKNYETDGKILDKKLLISYFVYSILFIIFGFIRYGSEYSYNVVINQIIQTVSFYGINVLWFVSTLFFGKAIVKIITKLINNINAQIIIIIIIYVLSYYLSVYVSSVNFDSLFINYLLVSLIRPFNVVIYLFTGYILKKNIIKLSCNTIKRKLLYISLAIVLLTILFFVSDYEIDYHSLNNGQILLNIVYGYFGTTAILLISCVLEKSIFSDIFASIGRNSMFLMQTEYFELRRLLYELLYKNFNFYIIDELISKLCNHKIHIPLHLLAYALVLYLLTKYVSKYINRIIDTINKKTIRL